MMKEIIEDQLPYSHMFYRFGNCSKTPYVTGFAKRVLYVQL